MVSVIEYWRAASALADPYSDSMDPKLTSLGVLLTHSPWQVGLELVIVVALRNRDRLMLIWPFVHDMLSTILAPEHARDANSLVRRATTGLLRICRRLLHYKAESSAALVKSLQMIRKLDPEVAWKMAPEIATEVRSNPPTSRLTLLYFVWLPRLQQLSIPRHLCLHITYSSLLLPYLSVFWLARSLGRVCEI